MSFQNRESFGGKVVRWNMAFYRDILGYFGTYAGFAGLDTRIQHGGFRSDLLCVGAFIYTTLVAKI